jgi:hypothetical protein
MTAETANHMKPKLTFKMRSDTANTQPTDDDIKHWKQSSLISVDPVGGTFERVRPTDAQAQFAQGHLYVRIGNSMHEVVKNTFVIDQPNLPFCRRTGEGPARC